MIDGEIKDADIPEYYTIKYMEMSDGSKLRHLQYRAEKPVGSVFMYPGMNTLVLSWITILETLPKLNYNVDYVESREKFTSQLIPKAKINQDRMELDMIEAVNNVDLEKNWIALGSSLGSTTFLRVISKGILHPKYCILVGPARKIHVPMKIRFIVNIMTPWLWEKVGKRIIVATVLKQYTDESKDPKQQRKYGLALLLADPAKLKKAIRSWNGHSIESYVGNIDGQKTQCILIGATEDKLHDVEETAWIAEHIDNARLIDLKTNSAAHEQPLIDLIQTLQ